MIELIPAIDLLDNQVVRLLAGDYNQVKRYGDPQEAARRWQELGIRRLHVVDLDGAKAGQLVNVKALESILDTGVEVQFGGGIRSWDSLELLFEMGVRLAILGTAAVKDPELMARALNVYKDRVILALDARDGKVAMEGWLEESSLSTEELLARLRSYGLGRFIYTDVRRDGTMTGPDISGAIRLCKQFTDMRCILSGGISCQGDLESVKRQACEEGIENLEGIISGRALYESKINVSEAIRVLASKC
jgi:phosphoribosylformimino-5-aminoimidazole carboxamide ribotide isomerase